jgi:uncharacterized protein (TIGR03086 family)
MPNGPVDQLSVALDAAEQVIAGVRPTQWDSPTGCAEWSVRDLVDHLVAGNFRFAALLSRVPSAAAEVPSDVDADRLEGYRQSVGALLDAFRRPGALEAVITVPIGSIPGIVALHLRTVEALVHGWDLAVATRQPADFPEDLAEQELTFSRAKLGDLPPGRSPFAPPQPVADDARAIDRLAACLGRPVTGATDRTN